MEPALWDLLGVKSRVLASGWHALNTLWRDVVHVQCRNNRCLLAVVNSKFGLFCLSPKTGK